jgi:molecular chaperone DnaK (HSP70)
VFDMQVSEPAQLVQESLVTLPMEMYQRFLEEEGQMTATDALEIATAEAKNNLEEYLLALRSNLSDRYADFVKPEDRDALTSELNALEDWLYEDGEEEMKSVRHFLASCVMVSADCLLPRTLGITPLPKRSACCIKSGMYAYE